MNGLIWWERLCLGLVILAALAGIALSWWALIKLGVIGAGAFL